MSGVASTPNEFAIGHLRQAKSRVCWRVHYQDATTLHISEVVWESRRLRGFLAALFGFVKLEPPTELSKRRDWQGEELLQTKVKGGWEDTFATPAPTLLCFSSRLLLTLTWMPVNKLYTQRMVAMNIINSPTPACNLD